MELLVKGEVPPAAAYVGASADKRLRAWLALGCSSLLTAGVRMEEEVRRFCGAADRGLEYSAPLRCVASDTGGRGAERAGSRELLCCFLYHTPVCDERCCGTSPVPAAAAVAVPPATLQRPLTAPPCCELSGAQLPSWLWLTQAACPLCVHRRLMLMPTCVHEGGQC